MVKAELNKILSHRIPNDWSKQAYLQGFGIDLPFKKSDNMFLQIEISE